jgi:hypothetical protein
MHMLEKQQPGIIYFHGYGSSPATDKVTVLKEHFSEVYAFPIDINPAISLPYLEEQIEKIFDDTVNLDTDLIFVGTSLGAWYAGRLAKKYYSPAVLINPCYSFKEVKIELDIPEKIKNVYDERGFIYPVFSKFFIDPEDEVINMAPLIESLKQESVMDMLQYEPCYTPGATHRFNGEPFERVIEFIKNETF